MSRACGIQAASSVKSVRTPSRSSAFSSWKNFCTTVSLWFDWPMLSSPFSWRDDMTKRSDSDRSSTSYDIVAIGSGHNGLTAAGYLAKSGKRVLVLERNAWPGGGVVSRELTL